MTSEDNGSRNAMPPSADSSGLSPSGSGRNLRHRAEERIKGQGSESRETVFENLRLVHELQLHQIELEMQNEELRSAQDALADSLKRVQSILDALHANICMLDRQGNIVFVNHAWRVFAKANGADLAKIDVGAHYFEVCESVQGNDRVAAMAVVEGIRAVMSGERDSYNCEYPCHSPEEERWFVVSATPIKEAGKACDWVVVAHEDITERKRAEQALLQSNRELRAATARANDLAAEAKAANEAKSAFLANMSHEIRTPLNAVLGFGRILERDTSLTPRQTEMLHTIVSSGQHLLNLVNDILDMSRIEAGRLELNPADFYLHDMLDEIEMVFRAPAHAKQLQLLLERDESVPRYVHADAGKLRQVLTNLLSNAIKFTRAGGVTVRVWCETAPDEFGGDPDALRLVVEVEDSGMGIAEEVLECIFEPFQQSGASGTARNAAGTGLGLPVSRRIVELMGGSLTVKSQVGKGSCFRFDALAKRAEGPVPDDPPARQQAIGQKPQTARIQPLTREDMAALPEALRQAMLQAVDEGDMAGLQVLIAQAEDRDAEVARKLRNLADQYDYETIILVLAE